LAPRIGTDATQQVTRAGVTADAGRAGLIPQANGQTINIVVIIINTINTIPSSQAGLTP
jgi:hypothetical protein